MNPLCRALVSAYLRTHKADKIIATRVEHTPIHTHVIPTTCIAASQCLYSLV